MSFDVFTLMKNREKLTAFDQILADEEHRDFIQDMDRFVCLVIVSAMQRQSGQANLALSDPANADVAKNARNAAVKLSQSEKAANLGFNRIFSVEIWKELIELTTFSKVQSFCNSSFMHPSVLWRVILTEELNEERFGL